MVEASRRSMDHRWIKDGADPSDPGDGRERSDQTREFGQMLVLDHGEVVCSS